ncbi:MAG: NnrS family protein [Polyangiales bacterium]
MRFAQHPLWLVGFRPFFGLAMLAGAWLPVLWACVYGGSCAPPAPGYFTRVQWHAHEMFYGFGWAVLGGFLLTATKNWVSVRGYHGPSLMALVGAWSFERVGMWFGGRWPEPLFRLSNNLFLASIIVMIVATLVVHRRRDSYPDNFVFLLVLPAFLVAKNLLLSPGHMALGTSMTLGLFRMAFLVMLERTLTPFMKGAFQVDILRDVRWDGAIKLLAALMVFEQLLPPWSRAVCGGSLVVLLVGRFLVWKPWLALRRLDIGIMYLGYLAITAQMALVALGPSNQPVWVGTVSVHLFTFGAMGLIIPAMFVRISKGHTGRKVVFDAGDRAVLWIMMVGLVARVVAPQLATEHYLGCIQVAAACWFACFSILAYRYLPFLWAPRVDGKEH